VSADDITRILLTEDSRSYALALRRFIEHDPDLKVVGTCGTIKETAAAMRTLDPDLLILDEPSKRMRGTRLFPSVYQRVVAGVRAISVRLSSGCTAAVSLA